MVILREYPNGFWIASICCAYINVSESRCPVFGQFNLPVKLFCTEDGLNGHARRNANRRFVNYINVYFAWFIISFMNQIILILCEPNWPNSLDSPIYYWFLILQFATHYFHIKRKTMCIYINMCLAYLQYFSNYAYNGSLFFNFSFFFV